MQTLVTVLGIEIAVFLTLLMVLLAFQMLTGRINTTGIVADESGNYSPGRVQWLTVVVLSALYYLVQLLGLPPGAHELPEIPPALVLLMGGSSLVYLGGKARPYWASLFPARR